MKEEKIISKFKSLKKIKPDPEWQALNRSFLLSQISQQNKDVEVVSVGWSDYVFAASMLLKRRLLEPAVVMLLVLGFSVGSSLLVNASFYSLPGERLYPVKLALENAQIAISPDDERQVELKIEFAKNRISEFDKIVSQADSDSQSKKEQLAVVVAELQKNVAAVQQHIDKEKNSLDGDHEKTLRIAISISNQTKQLAQTLDDKSKDISQEDPAVKQIVDEAVKSVQAVSQSADQLVQTEQSQSATSTDPVIDSQDDKSGQVLGEATTTDQIQTNTVPDQTVTD